MIKKIFMISIFCLLFFSCGKKGDPVYKDQNSQILQKKPITV